MVTTVIVYTIIFSMLIVYFKVMYDDSVSFAENLSNVKGYIFLFMLIVAASFFYLDFDTLSIKEVFLIKFGLTNRININNAYTLVTSNFIHADISHLFLNVLFLTFFAFLELQYGYIFFLLMFLIPSIVSAIILSFIIPQDTILLGSSIGLCSLYSIIFAENLLIDKLPVKIGVTSKIIDYVCGMVILFIITFLMSFGQKSDISNMYSFSAHFLGALNGYLMYSIIKHFTPEFYNVLIKYGKW
jgi:membrane associated rhomboid family serine protease